MASKARGRSKRVQNLINEEVEDTSNMRYDSEMMQARLEDLESELNLRISQLERERDQLANKIRQKFQIDMIKVPKKVATMRMADFVSQQSNKPSSNRPFVNYPSSNNSSIVPQTPKQASRSNYNALPLQTPSRAPQEGEMVLSQNGSPLGLFSAVRQSIVPTADQQQQPGQGDDRVPKMSLLMSSRKPRTYAEGDLPSEQQAMSPQEILQMELGNGRILSDLADIQSLSHEEKNDVKEQMQSFMERMQTMMSQLS